MQRICIPIQRGMHIPNFADDNILGEHMGRERNIFYERLFLENPHDVLNPRPFDSLKFMKEKSSL